MLRRLRAFGHDYLTRRAAKHQNVAQQSAMRGIWKRINYPANYA